jgi:hypothetical protein
LYGIATEVENGTTGTRKMKMSAKAEIALSESRVRLLEGIRIQAVVLEFHLVLGNIIYCPGTHN